MTDQERLEWYRAQEKRLGDHISTNFNEGFRTMNVFDTAIYLLKKTAVETVELKDGVIPFYDDCPPYDPDDPTSIEVDRVGYRPDGKGRYIVTVISEDAVAYERAKGYWGIA